MPSKFELQCLAREVLIQVWILNSLDRGVVDDNNEAREDVLTDAWRAFRVFWDALIESDEAESDEAESNEAESDEAEP